MKRLTFVLIGFLAITTFACGGVQKKAAGSGDTTAKANPNPTAVPTAAPTAVPTQAPTAQALFGNVKGVLNPEIEASTKTPLAIFRVDATMEGDKVRVIPKLRFFLPSSSKVPIENVWKDGATVARNELIVAGVPEGENPTIVFNIVDGDTAQQVTLVQKDGTFFSSKTDKEEGILVDAKKPVSLEVVMDEKIGNIKPGYRGIPKTAVPPFAFFQNDNGLVIDKSKPGVIGTIALSAHVTKVNFGSLIQFSLGDKKTTVQIGDLVKPNFTVDSTGAAFVSKLPEGTFEPAQLVSVFIKDDNAKIGPDGKIPVYYYGTSVTPIKGGLKIIKESPKKS